MNNAEFLTLHWPFIKANYGKYHLLATQLLDINTLSLHFSFISLGTQEVFAITSLLDNSLYFSELNDENLKTIYEQYRKKKFAKTLYGKRDNLELFANLAARDGLTYEYEVTRKHYELKENIASTSQRAWKMAKSEDRALVFKFLLAFFKEAFSHAHMGNDLYSLVTDYTIAKRRYLFLEVEGQPVAMLSINLPTQNECVIETSYTLPEYRRKGYAKELTLIAINLLKSEGYEVVYLDTNGENPISNALYKSIGFVEVGETVSYRFMAINKWVRFKRFLKKEPITEYEKKQNIRNCLIGIAILLAGILWVAINFLK